MCATSYSGPECMCSTGSLGSDGRSCSGFDKKILTFNIDLQLGFEVLPYISVTCMDENGGSRSVGETWEVYGLSCSCSPTGEVDCDMSGFDYASYFGF